MMVSTALRGFVGAPCDTAPKRFEVAGGAAPEGARPDLVRKFTAAMDDDLDTPTALRVLRQAVREQDAAGAHWMLGILAGTAALER